MLRRNVVSLDHRQRTCDVRLEGWRTASGGLPLNYGRSGYRIWQRRQCIVTGEILLFSEAWYLLRFRVRLWLRCCGGDLGG
jgi:hypothetical protein